MGYCICHSYGTSCNNENCVIKCDGQNDEIIVPARLMLMCWETFILFFFSFKKSHVEISDELGLIFFGYGFETIFFLWFRFFESNWTILRKVYYGFRVFKVLGFSTFRFWNFQIFQVWIFWGRVQFLSFGKPDPSLPEVPFYDLLYWVMYILQTHW